MIAKLAVGIPLVFLLVACSSSSEETASTPCSPTADGTKVTEPDPIVGAVAGVPASNPTFYCF